MSSVTIEACFSCQTETWQVFLHGKLNVEVAKNKTRRRPFTHVHVQHAPSAGQDKRKADAGRWGEAHWPRRHEGPHARQRQGLAASSQVEHSTRLWWKSLVSILRGFSMGCVSNGPDKLSWVPFGQAILVSWIFWNTALHRFFHSFIGQAFWKLIL